MSCKTNLTEFFVKGRSYLQYYIDFVVCWNLYLCRENSEWSQTICEEYERIHKYVQKTV